MFNLWRKYPKHKPKKNGTYLCTIQYGDNLDKVVVRSLYFDRIDGGKWIDASRQSVFDGYKVYPLGKLADDSLKVDTDSLCEFRFVSAWKKLPKGYKAGKVKK